MKAGCFEKKEIILIFSGRNRLFKSKEKAYGLNIYSKGFGCNRKK